MGMSPIQTGNFDILSCRIYLKAKSLSDDLGRRGFFYVTTSRGLITFMEFKLNDDLNDMGWSIEIDVKQVVKGIGMTLPIDYIVLYQ